jgi:hypothetical protein
MFLCRVVEAKSILNALCQNSHEDDERDFPPSDIAALSICILF